MSSCLKKVETILRSEPDPAFARRAKIIFNNLDLQKGQRVLDVGCGRGFYLKALLSLESNLDLFGLDLNFRYLAAAQKTAGPKAHLLKGDITQLPFGDNFFDRIIASEILEHIENDQKAISEIYRVLKPKGLAMITVPNRAYPFCWDPLNWSLERIFGWHIPSHIWWLAGLWADHWRLYRKTDLENKLTTSGFKVKKSWQTTRFCFPFSHFLLYGIGKNLVEKGLFSGYNRFSPNQKNSSGKILTWPFYLFDRLNQTDQAEPSVNIIFLLQKGRPQSGPGFEPE